ncbi:hypothetical protein L580_3244 [Serratia fonticola AU-P3(3)]|nr:hypothetical protein L580_3244 [Serratia fonticola AU-P3(3)]
MYWAIKLTMAVLLLLPAQDLKIMAQWSPVKGIPSYAHNMVLQ